MGTRTSIIVQGFGDSNPDAYVVYTYLPTRGILKIGTRRRFRQVLDAFIERYFPGAELPDPQFNQGMNIRYEIQMPEDEYLECSDQVLNSHLSISSTNKLSRLM